jgi:hypothetical protein
MCARGRARASGQDDTSGRQLAQKITPITGFVRQNGHRLFLMEKIARTVPVERASKG